jgi:hypothetical protein
VHVPPKARTVLDFTPDPQGLLHPVGAQSGGTASHRFRVQRGRDLVNLQVSAYGCELVTDGERTFLRAAAPKARLEVRLPFQHLGEESFEEGVPPTEFSRGRAAGGSRLVFAVPETEEIDYSVEGVLTGLRRLPLVVVPVAQPRSPSTSGRVKVAILAGGYGLFRGTDGLVLTKLTKAEQKLYARSSLGEVERVLADAVDHRIARQVLARETATDLTKGKALDLLDELVRPPIIRRVASRPRAPRSDETAIEAPYRLFLSPSTQGGFTHAELPVEASSGRVELWHSRLGVRVEGTTTRDDGTTVASVTVDERNAEQRIVRAVWARELDPGGVRPTDHQNPQPFAMSLDGLDRQILVRQTSDPANLTPILPVDARKLYVSALGAYLDLTGTWPPDPATRISPEIASWDHIAPMGRDQFVKVVYPGYLFPFGHGAALVKQTTRQVDAGPVARLHTEYFLIVTQPVRAYDDARMPFAEIRVRPLVTPGIRNPNTAANNSQVLRSDGTGYGQMLFWPKTDPATDFPFVLECLDRDGKRLRLSTPLLFVGQSVTPTRTGYTIVFPAVADITGAWNARPIPGQGKSIAFAPSATPGQTSVLTESLRFEGTPAPKPELTSTPFLKDAEVVIPAVQQLALPGQATTSTVQFPTAYLQHGYDPVQNPVQQFLDVVDTVEVDFTKGSDSGGGFLAPNLAVQALSRSRGAIGNPAAYGATGFDPVTALGGLLPKLFGVFDLTDLLGTDLPVPEFVSTALDEVSSLLADLQALHAAADQARERLAQDALSAATQGLRDQAEQARTALAPTLQPLLDAKDAFTDGLTALQALDEPADLAAVSTALLSVVGTLSTTVTQLKAAVESSTLPTAAKAAIERPLSTLLPLLADAGALIEKVTAFVSGIASLVQAGASTRASYAWSTPLSNFPAGSAANALFVAVPDGPGAKVSRLSMAVTAGPAGADVTAEITDFSLNLFPGAPLIALDFDRLAFHAAAGSKADVDVVFEGLRFQGILGFVNTLKELVPFDGFSDPPYLDVDSSGLRAGFDLALPAVAVGVFSLENISLHAGVDVPFLGEALTVGFSFCTREKPFRLTVMCIGGGGFVGLTLSPKGLVVLEMSLEAGASLSVDLGVASGSVSVMVGVYMRLEGEKGSLTGYFRIRGEVDVLGLISASITLELSLTYHFDSGKLIGRASIEIEIEVFLVSFSVSVSCERQLAGSNGDPTYAEVLTLDPVAGTAPEWDRYCAAFAAD